MQLQALRAAVSLDQIKKFEVLPGERPAVVQSDRPSGSGGPPQLIYNSIQQLIFATGQKVAMEVPVCLSPAGWRRGGFVCCSGGIFVQLPGERAQPGEPGLSAMPERDLEDGGHEVLQGVPGCPAATGGMDRNGEAPRPTLDHVLSDEPEQGFSRYRQAYTEFVGQVLWPE